MKQPTGGHGSALMLELSWDKLCGAWVLIGQMILVLPWLSGTLRDLQGGRHEKLGEALKAQGGKVQPLLRHR